MMPETLPKKIAMNIDEHLIKKAKTLAAKNRTTVGEMVAEASRRHLEPATATPTSIRNGIPLFPVAKNAGVVTPELVRELLQNES